MLVLSRKVGESIRIDKNITLTIVSLGRGKVSIGIEAPPEVSIMREELAKRLEALAASGELGLTT